MTRAINAGMLTDIASDAAETTYLLQLEFTTTLYATTAARDLNWNSQTWQALGGHMMVEPIGESLDRRAQGMRLTLSGVDQSVISVVLGQVVRGKEAVIYWAHFNPATGVVIDAPIEVFRGYMNDPFGIEEEREGEGAGGCTIKTRITSRLVKLGWRNGIKTNLQSHTAKFAGDTFFQNIPKVVGQEVFWGRPQPAGITHATPFNPSTPTGPQNPGDPGAGF